MRLALLLLCVLGLVFGAEVENTKEMPLNSDMALDTASANLPSAFAEEAERTRIENSIRLDASKLERDQNVKEELERHYTDSSARAEADDLKAKGLLSQGQVAASQAVGHRAEYNVEQSKASADFKEITLDRKLASLMAYRSQSLREHAKHRAEELTELEKQAEALRSHREHLLGEAKIRGRQAEAVISTADSLLASARAMSKRGAEAQVVNGESLEDQSKLERLASASKKASAFLEEDMERLARAKLQHKRLTGVEGVDELSRAQEMISALDRSLKKVRH